jgi:hypothetical protein
MKIILTENQIEFIRRYSALKELVENAIDVLDQDGDVCDYTLSEFLTEVCWQVSDHMDDLNMNRESLGTIEKIHRWVRNNFGNHITKEFNVLIDTHNCSWNYDDSYDEEYNLQESTNPDLKFIRRYEEIEDGVYDFILRHKITTMDTFDSFLIELSWDVANDVIRKINIPEDDYVTYRNQLIRFIKNNFYEELKEFWDRNDPWRDNKNINESYNKRMLQRRYQHFSESIDSTLSRYDVCLYTDVIDFVDRVMDYTADNLYESLFKLEWDDNHNEYYQDIYDFISEHFVDRIYEFYEDNKHFCIDEDGNWIH